MEVKENNRKEIVFKICIDKNDFKVTKEDNANNYDNNCKPYVIFDIKNSDITNSIKIMNEQLLRKEGNIYKFSSFYSKFIKHCIINEQQINNEIMLQFKNFYKDNVNLLNSCFTDKDIENEKMRQLFIKVFLEYDFTKKNQFFEYKQIMLKFMKVINCEYKKEFDTKIYEMLSSPLFAEMNFNFKQVDQEFKTQLLPIYIKVFSQLSKLDNCLSFVIQRVKNGKTEFEKLNKELDSYGIDNTLINEIDRCAWIYFSKDKNKLLEMMIPSFSIGKIIELTKTNPQNDFVKKYTEIIKGIKEKSDISKVIFVYTSDAQKKSIINYYQGKKSIELGTDEKIQSKKDEIYLKEILKRSVLLDEGFYYIQDEFFKLLSYFSLNETKIEYTIDLDNFIKDFNISTKTNKSKETQNLFALFKDEINKYLNSVLKKEIKHYNNNKVFLKEIKGIIESKDEFFVKLFSQFKVVYSKNKDSINKEKLKKCLENDLSNNCFTLSILEQSKSFENFFLLTFKNKEQFLLKYIELLSDEEKFEKETQNCIPSIFSAFNYSILEYLFLLFPNISDFFKKIFELTVNMKQFSQNKSFSTQISYFYLFIKKYFHYFSLLETLSKYAINLIDISQLVKMKNTIHNNKNNNVIWNILQFIITKNTITNIIKLSAIQLVSFRKFCHLAEYIDKQLALKTNELFMIKKIELILLYLADDKEVQKTLGEFISTNIFSSEELINISKFIVAHSNKFNCYDEFIGKFLREQYYEENSNIVIMKLTTWKSEYLLNSKDIFCNIILSSINYLISFEKEEDFDFEKIIPKTIFQNLKGIKFNDIYFQQFILSIMQNHLYLYVIKELSSNPSTTEDCFLTSEQCNIYMIKCTKYLFDYKNEKVKNILHFLFCIAFLKVYLYFYYENSNRNFDFSNINSFLNSKEYDLIKNVLKLYVLKNVRKGVKSYKEFQNYNYINNQMLWVSSLTFKDSSESLFEYYFFSNMKQEQSYIDKYYKLEKIYNDLSTKIFRTNEYNEEILKLLCSYDDRELFIDLVFNKIYAQLNSNNFKEQSLLFYEFTSWISNLLKLEKIKKIDERVIKYYNVLFTKIKILTQFAGEDLNKIEVILISMKMILLFFSIDSNKEIKCIAEPKDDYEAFNTYEINKYIKRNYFNKKDGNIYMYKTDSPKWKKVISQEDMYKLSQKGYVVYEEKKVLLKIASLKPKAFNSKNIAYLKVTKKCSYTEDTIENISHKIVIFILYSYYYYYQMEIDLLKEEEQNSLKEVFDDIVLNLHVIGIKNEKIFINVLYCELKQIINNLYTLGKETMFYNSLRIEIENQIQKYIEKQDSYIEYMNKIMNINPSDLRNYTLDQRVPKDTNEYPFLDFFYYTQFPTLDNFRTQFNKIYNKECKYPFINEFINNKIDLFAIPKETIDQLLQKIKENMNDDTLIEKIKDKEEYSYNGQYNSLEEIIVTHSYNNIYKNNTVLPFNGDIVVYDYNGIEQELSTILYNIK